MAIEDTDTGNRIGVWILLYAVDHSASSCGSLAEIRNPLTSSGQDLACTFSQVMTSVPAGSGSVAS